MIPAYFLITPTVAWLTMTILYMQTQKHLKASQAREKEYQALIDQLLNRKVLAK